MNPTKCLQCSTQIWEMWVRLPIKSQDWWYWCNRDWDGINCQWVVDCETGRCGGAWHGRDPEMSQLSKGNQERPFWHANELKGLGLLVWRAERSRLGWLLGNMGMTGMDTASSDQSNDEGAMIVAVVVMGFEMGCTSALASMKRGGGSVWDAELWTDWVASTWIATSMEGGGGGPTLSTWTAASSLTCTSQKPASQRTHVSSLLKHHCPWPSISQSPLSVSIPTICPWSAPSQNACFTSMSLKKAASLLNPSCDPCSNACFQMRPNGEFGDDVARAMSFAMLSSDTGSGDDSAAVVVDVSASSDTAGGGCVMGCFFNAGFFSGMVMYGGDVTTWCMGDGHGSKGGKMVWHMV